MVSDTSSGSSFVEDGNGITKASLELLYHVSREFAAALDLSTVLDRVLFLSSETVGATTGSIIVMDESGKPVESAIIVGGQLHNQTTQRLRVTLERGLAGWVVRNKKAVLIRDTSKDDRWMSRRYELESQSAPKSVVSAPLLVRERMVGVMTLSHQTPDFFTEEHLSLVQAIADQAALSVYNARLYAESQRQARVMSALAESAAAITASINLEDVLMRILEQIRSALQVPAVSLALIDPSGDLVFKAALGWKTTTSAGKRVRLGQGIAGWVVKEGRGLVIHDVQKDPRYDPEIEARTGLEVHAVAGAPIRSRGEVMGVLEALDTTQGGFDPDALFVLTGIGSLAGTAIRHAQLFERLQAAHHRYLELFEDSIEPILITDCEGNILEANRQAAIAVGAEIENLLNLNIRRLHELDIEKLGKNLENLNSGDTISYDSQLHTMNEQEIPIQVYVRQVIIEGAKHLQWILFDTTERKKLDTLREDLLSMIYHDLRSPLANVVSSLDTANSILSENADPSLKSLIDIAIRSTGRIQRLTHSLLDIHRFEAGQPIVDPQPFQMALIVDETIDAVRFIIDSMQQDVYVDLPSSLPSVMGDADMIRRVLTNLLENASKYSPLAGRIEIGGSQEDDFVRFWLQDNGPGIPEEDRERIFDKFARLRSKDGPKGLGLGLTYCRLAIEGHGGRIWVESETGKGARFIFTLPAVRE